MYEQYYGFTGKPFQLSPDPRFFFNSPSHARALAYLQYGVQQGEGFVVVTGPVGTGKTTLARMLYEDLRNERDVVVAQLVMTNCSGDDLLRMIAEAFGIGQEGLSKATVLKSLDAFLRSQHAEGRRVLLLLDEVQNLPDEALETLRMLSNLQEGEHPLLQSLLLGQAEFRRSLRAGHLEQLRQRVIASCHLDPLGSPAQTREYIEHRLQQVGWREDPVLADDSFERIHDTTHGIPRQINTFCDRLLLFAFLEELHWIDGDTVDAVAHEIMRDTDIGPPDELTEPAELDRLARLERRVCALETALDRARQAMDRSLASASPAEDRRERAMGGSGDGA